MREQRCVSIPHISFMFDVEAEESSKERLTLKPVLLFLQQRQASMRKTKKKRPDRETATTARDEDQDSSLSGAPSAGHRVTHRQNMSTGLTLI